MSNLHLLSGVGAVVVTAGVVFGVLAITIGWLPPGAGRAKVLRPRVWGYGTLTTMAGFGTFLYLGPLQGPATAHFLPSMAGMAVAFVGLSLQRLSYRRGRTPQDPGQRPTKTAS
ncbi:MULTISPECIES: hypothetical protein [unclassified Streptomyces]|uniref:hypothetical protein n=1 Tax=unclassified Streptomyces TaxID=2593676 RepID=UPI00325661EA